MANKYYYYKPKTDSGVTYRSSGLHTRTNQPEHAQDTHDHTPAQIFRSQGAQPDSVLDMSFAKHASSSAAATAVARPIFTPVSVTRLLILTVLIISIYLGGFGVYAQAGSLIDDISNLSSRGVAKLEAASVALSEKDFAKATDNFTAAENLFTQAQNQLLGLGQSNLYLSNVAGSDMQIISGIKLVDAGLSLSKGGKGLVTAMGPSFQYFNALGTQPVAASDVPGQIASLLSASEDDLTRAIAQVDKANQLLGSIDPNRIDPGYRVAVMEAKEKTASLQQATSVLGTLAKELPDALGFNNPRKYLLLNQNSNELRATGGFIGSFTIFTLYKGKIDEVFVDITQRVDGQNPRPSIELPAPLATIAKGSFGTRDANWYPDFPQSAKTFQKLYEEAGGGTVDGIIAINPTLMQQLLNVTGPIELPGKGETVTTANFVELTQQYTQVIDNQKENPKEILSELAPIMLDKIMNMPASDTAKVNEVLMSLLASKDIMLYMRDPQLQRAITTLNFAGTMPDVADGGDFLAVIRSNLGARKSSGNTASRITHLAGVNLAGDIESTLTLSYTHQGKDEFPDGPNKDYIRVYVPKGSTLSAITGQDAGTNAEVYEEGDKTIIAFWLTTNPGETSDVTLKYQPKVRLKDQYNLQLFKQSGDDSWLRSTLRVSAALGLEGDMDNKSKQLFDGRWNTDLHLSARLSRAN